MRSSRLSVLGLFVFLGLGISLTEYTFNGTAHLLFLVFMPLFFIGVGVFVYKAWD